MDFGNDNFEGKEVIYRTGRGNLLVGTVQAAAPPRPTCKAPWIRIHVHQVCGLDNGRADISKHQLIIYGKRSKLAGRMKLCEEGSSPSDIVLNEKARNKIERFLLSLPKPWSRSFSGNHCGPFKSSSFAGW